MTLSSVMARASSQPDRALGRFEDYFNGVDVDPETVIVSTLRTQYPSLKLVSCEGANVDLIGFAGAGKATCTMLDPEKHRAIRHVKQVSRRPAGNDAEEACFVDTVKFGRYLYEWDRQEFLLYRVKTQSRWRSVDHYLILCEPSPEDPDSISSNAIDRLLNAATFWALEPHDEILVFGHRSWAKDKALFKSVQKTSWEDVVLESSMKSSLIKDAEGFFDAKSMYKDLGVPWKRGIIFHGQPGNGKTFSLKALMNSLAARKEPIPSLYVKTIEMKRGNHTCVQEIFTKARRMAPCLLVFEDIDSLVEDNVKSYFLNEMDGLEDNDGILVVATTNYLEKMDSALAHRPSRFDKKFSFLCPAKPNRIQYCEYWRRKLSKNNLYSFPEILCEKIADITEDFTFAHLKELFLSTLLSLARDPDTNADEDVEKLETLSIWKRIQVEAEWLRKDIATKSSIVGEVVLVNAS